ncbi:hypothetical protein FT663_03888 [Candidozyma haemuli var. vulneris]|uniref:Metal resistance protein YCF1 n=1 Tax=Candidozyma haemuli TaxID=45357 RepID=A0A2V1AMM1_9ASCO|nr:hypothetical protein CXQ85_001627 [[Candida] haemuloni]KAF3987485.1 hypothetical protein FT662_03961 [[Candida] haemuloni var. vulneris]KAF3988783.1 hypothetical protein FT663_03888 [[Candida] haemuloni var. vulneris]PVH19320.1 hypothetical protein CXQ85_001627 [[Candida] haemuloni]
MIPKPSEPLICGPRALLHPLVPTLENAFNPCFLAQLLLVLVLFIGPPAIYQLVCVLRNPQYGSLSIKCTRWPHFIRSVLVATVAVLSCWLTAQVSIHERYADYKLIGFGSLSLLLVFVLLPLHALEPLSLPIQSGALLAFWPAFVLLQAAIVYQDSFTNWPLLLANAAHIETTSMLLSVVIFVLEASKRTWKPTHELLIHYMNNETLAKELRKPNFLEQITFTWMNGLITSSYENGTLSHQDLPEIPSRISTELYMKRLSKHYDPKKNPNITKSGLLWALIKAFGPLGLISFSYELIDKVLNFIQPQLLRLLIVFVSQKVSDPNTPALRGFIISFGMFFVTLIQTSMTNRFMMRIQEFGFSFKASLTSLVFQKSLRLSSQALAERSSGDIVNLISIDAPRVQACAQEISTLIIAPTEFVICMISLWALLGKASLAGAGVILFSFPANAIIVRFQKRLSKKQMQIKDERNRVTNEILVSMRSIKFYSWENPMLKHLLDIRNGREMTNLRKKRLLGQVSNFLWILIPFLVSFATFATFAITSTVPLTSDIVFPALTLLEILSKPILNFPAVFNYIIEGSVALDRITSFLGSPEVDESLVAIKPSEDPTSLEIQNLSFLWSKPEKSEIREDMDFASFKYALRNINLKAQKYDLVCIVGRVGSGKSALLSSIIGQLSAIHSSSPQKRPSPISLHGSIAYCTQNPWIMNASVKENILFGHEFDPEYYQKTIEACQLLPDLKVLPDNDDTQVGEKGISLSGGQKARLALARAVYARANIYLLDDVLSAVDSHVGKKIINQVFSKSGLLARSTIVLATNNIPVLSNASKIYYLENGSILEEARYNDISPEAFPKLNRLVTEFGGSSPQPSKSPSPTETPAPSVTHSKAIMAPFEWDPLKKNTVSKRTAQSAEVSAKGKVNWNVYYDYIKACSTSGVLVWVAIFVASTLVSVRTTYWLKQWAERNSAIGNNSDALRFISIYAVLGLTTSLLTSARGVLFWAFLGLRGGKVIHERMARRLMKVPMLFFERTPVGRIMNRFSNDVNKIDDALPRSFNNFLNACLKTTMTLVIVVFAIPPSFFVLIVLAFSYRYYQKYYVAVQREIKRLVSVSRSPIFAHFQESLNGADTVRAYRQQDRFLFINDANVDFNLRSLYMLRSVNRWLSVRLQMMGSLLIWISSSLLIYKASSSSPLSAGMVGFVMSYSLQVTSWLRLIVRFSAEVESNIVSVERCLEYAELKPEEDENTKFQQPSPSWPEQGAIDVKEFSGRYAKNLDMVLKNVSFSVKPGEKVGVVGRTGAGKSSLVLAIFRMISSSEGSIFIDGLDINTLRLFDLRHNLSIIPQDSHMFEGTVRENLDPFTEHSDDKLWRVLELSSLKQTVERLDGGQGLDSSVSEGGGNFSAGQKQLICLGRALLNPSKVLLLDEATAAVDVQTDQIIQQTIRQEFKEKTIITIAHRLNTVMDSDRILVLDHGEVKEYDAPETLLRNPQSQFRGMCEANH